MLLLDTDEIANLVAPHRPPKGRSSTTTAVQHYFNVDFVLSVSLRHISVNRTAEESTSMRTNAREMRLSDSVASPGERFFCVC